MIGASFDTVAENAAFAAKYGFGFPLLSDPTRALGMAFGAADGPDAGYAKRVSALVDAEGKVAKLYAKVEPATHPDQVLADLAAGAGGPADPP